MTMARRHHESGALLVELLIAVLILSLVAVGISMTLGGASRLEVGNQARNRLSAASESVSEKLRSDTSWMQSCTTSCSLDYMFDGSPTSGPYNDPHPGLVHPDFGTIEVDVQATPVDSDDDGKAPNDKDQQPIDSYAIRIEVAYPDANRLSEGLKPVVLESTISTSTSTATGALALQVCRVRDQADERLAIRECNVARQQRMEPGARYDAATGGLSSNDQAWTCAHPDHYRAPGVTAYENARANGPGVLNSKCSEADGPYRATTVPSYRPPLDFFGTTVYDPFPNFSPRASTLPSNDPSTPWNDRYRFVSSIIEPVPNMSVRIDGFADTATSGVTRIGTTDAQGIARWSDLTPGRYRVTVSSALAGTTLSDEMSVPGTSVTVAQGIESRATQVFLPTANKSIRIALRTSDVSYPWTGLQPGWRVMGGDFKPPYALSNWNGAWGAQGGGAGAPYRTHWGLNFNWNSDSGNRPGPWPLMPEHSTWRVHNSDGSPQPLCLRVVAVPYGRLVDGGKTVCHHPPAGGSVPHYDFGPLAPGLYTFDVLGIPAFVWRRENNPGFLWIDENGTTYPPSSGAWSSHARASFYGCRDAERDLARWLFDPNLPASPCGAAVDSSVDEDGGGGGG